MKKVTSKIIAILLSLTLVFTMSGVAFADTGSLEPMNKDTVSVSNETVTGKISLPNNTGKSIKTQSYGWEPVNTKAMINTATSNPAYSAYDLQPYTYVMTEVVAPGTGWLWLDYKVTGVSDTDGVDVYLCESIDETTGEMDYYESASGGLYCGTTATNCAAVYVTKGQVLYLYMETPEWNEGDLVVETRGKLYSTVQNRTLPVYTKSTSYMWISGIAKPVGDSEEISPSSIYVKVKPTKTGVMTVDLKTSGYTPSTGKVTLYNSSKTRLSDSKIQYNSSKTAAKAYFGVTKGKTYYIKVDDCYGTPEYAYRYGIKYSVASSTDRNISSTSKALKLSKGGTGYKTLFTATNAASADYYKLYVSKTSTTKFSVDTTKIRSGKVYVRVYKNGKQVGSTKIINPNTTKTTFTITYGTTSGKATKGTYYIKVSKTAKGSGQYSIKYLK